MKRDEEIKIIAYRIWEEEGYSHGSDVEHWLKAEVIWEETQKNEDVSADAKAKLKQTGKHCKAERAASKKH